MNCLKHPVSLLTNVICEFNLSDDTTKKIISHSLFYTALPAFLSLELIFKRFPQFLKLQFQADTRAKSKCIEKIKKLTNGILNVYSSSRLQVTDCQVFMSLEVQKKFIKSHPRFLQLASLEIKGDREFILDLISEELDVFEYCQHSLKEDPLFVLQAVRVNIKALEYASEYLRDNPKYVTSLLRENPDVFFYASDNLRSNRVYIYKLVTVYPQLIYWASVALQSDKLFIVELASLNETILEFVPSTFKLDKQFLLEVLKRNVRVLRYFHKSLAEDEGFFLEAIKINGRALDYAGSGLKGDKKFISHIIKTNPEQFYFALDLLRSDRDFIAHLVQETAEIFYYSLDSVRNDIKFILTLVMINAEVIDFVPLSLKTDPQFLIEAIKNNEMVFEFIPEQFKQNKPFVYEAFLQNNPIVSYISQSLMADYDFVHRLVCTSGITLRYASISLRDDQSIVLSAVRNDYRAIIYASDRLKNNEVILLESVRRDGLNLQHASENLKDNYDIVFAAVTQNGQSLEYASSRMRDNINIVKEALKMGGRFLEYASLNLQADKSVVMLAVTRSGQALQFASLDLKNDIEVVITAVRQFYGAFIYASFELQQDPEVFMTALYGSIPTSKCKIGVKRYFPNVLSSHLKELELPQIPQESSIEHLKGSLAIFIDSLTPLELSTIQRELVEPHLTLEEAKSRLRDYHKILFIRLTNREAYLGTPPKDSLELQNFYRDIEYYLRHLDFYFSRPENQMPQALIERLQLLQTQTACGARFQAEVEQLFVINCTTADSLSLDKQCAYQSSMEVRKIIEGMAVSSDVHEIINLTWQLDPYLVGPRVVKDHLTPLKDDFELMKEFLAKHTARKFVENIQMKLVSSSEFEELFTAYIKEHIDYELTSDDEAKILDETKQLLEFHHDRKKSLYARFMEAKRGIGPHGKINNPDILRSIFQLTHQEFVCQSEEELVVLMEKDKGTTFLKLHTDSTKAYIFDKLLEDYWDIEKNRWSMTIIALMLEKMGILIAKQ